jgi:hypothetical protein
MHNPESSVAELEREAVRRMSQPDISNLNACIADVKQAAWDTDSGPAEPVDFHQLRGRLEAARDKMPPLYVDSVYKPFVNTLDRLGPSGFTQVLMSDPERERGALVMLDIAQAILQQAEGYNERATDGFQEVVSDLYDGFLSAEDRAGTNPPDRSTIPPLVKWGYPGNGPYTLPIDATAPFGLKTGIVSLPPANARHGLFAWAALGHETGGHDILHADTGLLNELRRAVWAGLQEQGLGYGLPTYWSQRIDETASDVLGILNMGAAAGIGLVGYFRGLNAASPFTRQPILRNDGSSRDPHPADILRGYLAAETVRLLVFDGAAAWADVIEKETDKDLQSITVDGRAITPEAAKLSAKIVAQTIVQTKLRSLEDQALGHIQNWHNEDEEIIQQLRPYLTSTATLPAGLVSAAYAAHVVAAAVTQAIGEHANIPMIFDRMTMILKTLHNANPSWGPLFVVHPGNMAAHRAYVPHV